MPVARAGDTVRATPRAAASSEILMGCRQPVGLFEGGVTGNFSSPSSNLNFGHLFTDKSNEALQRTTAQGNPPCARLIRLQRAHAMRPAGSAAEQSDGARRRAQRRPRRSATWGAGPSVAVRPLSVHSIRVR